MDTTNLEIGMTVSNYKELCNLLGEDAKTGNAKKAQLKEWSRYFEFERPKYKRSYIILDIYDEPLEKEDDRHNGNHNIYVKFIETILINYLSKQPGNTRTFTRRNWWELLGMVNEKYNKVSLPQLKKTNSYFTEFEVNHFYNRCNRKLDSILITALKNLRNRKLIEWQYQTVIIDSENKYYIADDTEIEYILRVENQVLTTVYKLQDIRQIYSKGLQKEYYKAVNDILYEEYGYKKYYKQIKIIYPQDCMIAALPKAEIELQKLLLNANIVKYINKEATNINNKWIQAYQDGETSVYPYIYLDAQYMLVDELIKPISKDKNIDINDLNNILESVDNESEDELGALFSEPLNSKEI